LGSEITLGCFIQIASSPLTGFNVLGNPSIVLTRMKGGEIELLRPVLNITF